MQIVKTSSRIPYIIHDRLVYNHIYNITLTLGKYYNILICSCNKRNFSYHIKGNR